MRIWSYLRALTVITTTRAAAALTIAVLLPPALLQAQGQWKIQYFYDKLDSDLAISDIQCPSAKRCIAAGVITDKNGNEKGAVVLTSDGGAHWSLQNVKENPLSLFFLNDSEGWMVTEHGIWASDEGGSSWRKLEALKGIVRVHFLDASHGFAIGFPKAVYETTDGGKKWNKLAAAKDPPSDPKNTIYDCIAFLGPTGVILGSVDRDSLDPDALAHPPRLEQNSTTVILDTSNGGQTWRSIAKTYFGSISRVALSKQGYMVLLVEYRRAYTLPSTVFKWAFGAEQMDTIFAERNRAVTDLALFPDGSALLAAIEPPGASNQIPIPGKLKMLASPDLKTWREMDVDYRAVGQRAVLAAVDARNVWVATDTGMILKLDAGAASRRRQEDTTTAGKLVLSTSSPQSVDRK